MMTLHKDMREIFKLKIQKMKIFPIQIPFWFCEPLNLNMHGDHLSQYLKVGNEIVQLQTVRLVPLRRCF